MNINAALYIGADPFTFNDLALVQKVVNMFGFVYIFLDRKNRDPEYKEYLLNYADRADIIKHDLKNIKIDSFKIVPIDHTLQQSLKENFISTLVLNFDYQQATGFKTFKIFQQVNPDLNIILLKGNDYIEPKFIKTLLDSDSSMSIYKKFCSDYSFIKLKIKTMKKVGITGMVGTDYSIYEDVFKDHGYTVINIDKILKDLNYDSGNSRKLKMQFSAKDILFDKFDKFSVIERCIEDEVANNIFQHFIYDVASQHISEQLKTTFNNKVAIFFSMACELGMEGMFDKTILVKCSRETINKNLAGSGYTINCISNLDKAQMSFKEQEELCDYSFDQEESLNQMIRLLNTKLKNF